MKPGAPFLFVLSAALLASPAGGQGIRGVTRRITTPPPAIELPPSPPQRSVPATVVVVSPADPAKVAAAKAEQDKRVVEFQKKRAEQGSPTAQFDLGVRYLSGEGVERNLQLARKWLAASAKNGNKQAATKLEELGNLEKERQSEGNPK